MSGGWQPIESAPKDGTEVLIWTSMYGGGTVIARWDDDKFAKSPKPRWEARDRIYGRKAFLDCPPRHWMPLPSAPEGE